MLLYHIICDILYYLIDCNAIILYTLTVRSITYRLKISFTTCDLLCYYNSQLWGLLLR